MNRRQAIATLGRAAGGLVLVRCFPGCAPTNPEPPTNQNNNTDAEPSPLLTPAADDHVRGDPEAANVIIEYVDFESSACGDFFRDNLPAVLEQLVDTGQAAFVIRHFPQPELNLNARLAAVASECAVDFFEFHDLLFNNQDDHSRSALVSLAEQVGLDPTTFQNCLNSGAKVPRIDRDVDSGLALGVKETPTFFVNAKMLAGNRTLEDFQAHLV